MLSPRSACVQPSSAACKARGAKRALPLPVSAPFHSSLMQPAAERLRDFLGSTRVAAPSVPLVNNVDVAMPRDPAQIKDALVRQAASPVRWVEIIRHMAGMGITHVVECGPGKVLAGLTKRCADGVTGVALADAAAIEANLGLE